MADLPAARQIRRFRAIGGTEYDELPNGFLRRRLKADDKSPIPSPQTPEAVERKEGPLREIDPASLRRQANKGERWRRGCKDCGKTSCWGECTPKRQKGKRR